MKTINQVPVYPDHNAEMVKIGTKTYYVCSVCGRLSTHKVKAHKRVWCQKHYNQQKKYGKVLDTNPRTLLDRNEIRIINDVAYIGLYDAHENVVGVAMVDAEDVNKVRYTKWKLSASGYAMNTPKFQGGNIHMSHVILDTEEFVDHINHNRLDNRKKNLRVVIKSQNAMNMDSTGVIKQKDGKFYAHIKRNQKKINLGVYVFPEEAAYARWYAEQLLFGEHAYPKKKPVILADRERDIQEYVNRKVQRL